MLVRWLLCAVLVVVVASPVCAADDFSVSATSFPTGLAWDQTAPASVTLLNTGTTIWDAGYALVPIDPNRFGYYGVVDTWTTAAVPLTGYLIESGESHQFSFDITAPPFTSLSYSHPWTAESEPAPDYLECAWTLASPWSPDPTLVTDAYAGAPVTIGRFADTLPGTLGEWAFGQIEECAGRVPPIVTGYEDGLYHPRDPVTRDQMAVFLQRALQLPEATYLDEFSDLTADSWGAGSIQALVDAGIVQGKLDGTYGPWDVVTRDQMAVFIARGRAGGEANVPTGPASPTFTDVDPSYWAYDSIEYCVGANIAKGYEGGQYHKWDPVARDQMAVFMYRAFMRDRASLVVLGGPNLYPVSGLYAPYYGRPDGITTLTQDEAWLIYWGFYLDAQRLGPELAAGDALTIFVDVLGPVWETMTGWLYAGDLTYLRETSRSSWYFPHYLIESRLPWTAGGLPPGDYTLRITFVDSAYHAYYVPREVHFIIVP